MSNYPLTTYIYIHKNTTLSYNEELTFAMNCSEYSFKGLRISNSWDIYTFQSMVQGMFQDGKNVRAEK